MADSWCSKVAWKQLNCAYGDSREVGELLQQVLAGEDVWVELFGHVLHQETIYEATVAVAPWMVEAADKKVRRAAHSGGQTLGHEGGAQREGYRV